MNFLEFAGSHEKILVNLFLISIFILSANIASAQVLRTPALSEFPEVFANFPATIVVGPNAPASDVLAAIDVSITLQNTTPTQSITANGFEDVFRKSIISVGNACSNPVTADLIGFPDSCESAIPNNTAVIKIIALPFSDRYAMVVAGSSEELTRLAAQVLANHETYLANVEAPEIIITGTSLSDAAVQEVPQQQIFFMQGIVNISLDARNASTTVSQNGISAEYKTEFNVVENNTVVSKVNAIILTEQNITPSGSLNLGGSSFGAVNFDINEQRINALAFFNSFPARLFFVTSSHAILLQKFDINLDGNKTGELYFATKLFDLPEQKTTYALQPEGALEIDPTNFEVTNTLPKMWELSGTVTTADGRPLQSGAANFSVGNFIKGEAAIGNGQYLSFFSAFDNETVTVSVEDQTKSARLAPTLEPSTTVQGIRIDFVLARNSTNTNFPDQDIDGVPDIYDKCPGSNTTIVDNSGCSCEQKKCEDKQLVCLYIGNGASGPLCVSSCSDGFKNGAEEGIDCGGPCKPCCSPANTCVKGDQPIFCSEERKQVPNCQQCGCPEEFTCREDGECIKQVAQEGIRCKINEYYYLSYPYDCSSLGPTWVQENQMNYFRVHTGGWMASKTRSAANRMLRQFTVCINTKTACVAPGTKCPEEDHISEFYSDAYQMVQAEVNKQVRKAMSGVPSFWARLRINVVNLDQFKIRETFECPNITITPQTGCKNLINNGPEKEKADILFIGDGFYDFEELEKEVRKEIDYESQQEKTPDEGLFSIEPFKSAKQKFNIWYLPAKNEINTEFSPSYSSFVPRTTDALNIASRCAIKPDYIIVLSKKLFRSYCYFGTPCFDSVVFKRNKGRLLLHEFGGHGFASLGDEYHNFVELKDADGRVEEFMPKSHTAPNCKPTQENAQTEWADLLGGPVGFFKSCGGDCPEQCTEFVRPTLNSIMKDQDAKIDCIDPETNNRRPTPDCMGPPFEPYHPVNKREINKVLQRYH